MAARATSGVQSIYGADALQREREAREKYPYVWSAAPPGSEHVYREGFIDAPGDNNQHVILEYQVPNNRRFVFRGLVLSYSNPGGGWVPGDGNVVFSVTVNRTAGASNPQGIPYKDYGVVRTTLGSFTQGPWPIDPGELSVIQTRNVLRAIVATDSAVITDGLFGAIFMGWTIPE